MGSTGLMLVSVAFVIGSVAAGDASDRHETTVAALKRAYLECERRALTDDLSAGEVAECSTIYEQLKLRAFNGDWTRIREWTEANLNPGWNT